MRIDRRYVVETLKALDAGAIRKLGQNFLVAPDIARDIVMALDIGPGDMIIEIGPGLGSLTEHLAGYPNPIKAYDIDPMMVRSLKETFGHNQRLEIFEKDFLKVVIGDENTKVIGNLPYYITTPLIEKVLLETKNLKVFVAMVQKEAIERLTAKPCTKEYGPLNILISLLGGLKAVMTVSKESFYPVPHVDSCVFRMIVTRPEDIDISKFYDFLGRMFFHRRKTILNNLAGYTENKKKAADVLSSQGIPPMTRPEELDLPKYLALFKALS